MAINKSIKANFKVLTRAFENGDVAILECREKKTGKIVPVIVAVSRTSKDYSFTPFAVMINEGNPFEDYEPPNPDGGFTSDEKDPKENHERQQQGGC